MSYRFFCKTQEGYVIKNLIELLQSNIKNGCFTIDKEGIYFRMTDSNRKTLIDVEFYHVYFNQYKFKSGQKIMIGLNLSHFYKMLKNIKKKDSIVLFINDDNDSELGIRVIPKEKNRLTTSYVKIQNLQSIDIDLPDGYNKPIIIPSNEYSKMIKDLSNIGGNTINISSNQSVMKFYCDNGGVYNREIVFGEDDEEEIKEYLVQEYNTEQLTRISKITGLSNQLQLFQSKDLPFCLKSNIGSIGKIEIYTKDKNQIQESLNENDD